MFHPATRFTTGPNVHQMNSNDFRVYFEIEGEYLLSDFHRLDKFQGLEVLQVFQGFQV